MTFLLSIFLSCVVEASVVLGPQDQAQWEKLLRKIPAALVKNEDKVGFSQRTYTYPSLRTPFQITCTADHEKSAPEPHSVVCFLKMVTGSQNGVKVVKVNEEYVVTLSEAATVGNLQKALAGRPMVSERQTKFKNRLGIDKRQPRYVLKCGKRSCRLTFGTTDSR